MEKENFTTIKKTTVPASTSSSSRRVFHGDVCSFFSGELWTEGEVCGEDTLRFAVVQFTDRGFITGRPKSPEELLYLCVRVLLT